MFLLSEFPEKSNKIIMRLAWRKIAVAGESGEIGLAAEMAGIYSRIQHQFSSQESSRS